MSSGPPAKRLRQAVLSFANAETISQSEEHEPEPSRTHPMESTYFAEPLADDDPQTYSTEKCQSM